MFKGLESSTAICWPKSKNKACTVCCISSELSPGSEMFDREIYLLVASFDSHFKARIEVKPPAEHIHRLRGGYCSLQDVILMQPSPCFPVAAKCHSSDGDFTKGIRWGLLPALTGVF